MIATTLVYKWEAAKTNLVKTEDAFQQLSTSIDNTWIVEWTRQETTAMLECGKAMEIYDVSLGKGAISLETPPLLVAPCRAHSE